MRKRSLRAAVEKRPGADLLREMTGFAAGQLMQRNGQRERDWQTRAGRLQRRIHLLRRGACFLGFVAPLRMAKTALTAVIQEA
jgi:putative transposase